MSAVGRAGCLRGPFPRFLGGDSKYMHMLYWANLEEPNADKYKEDCES